MVQGSEGSESNSEVLIRPSNTVYQPDSEKEEVFAKKCLIKVGPTGVRLSRNDEYNYTEMGYNVRKSQVLWLGERL